MLNIRQNVASDFEMAQAEWTAAREKRRTLLNRLDGAKLALALAEHPPIDGEVRSPVIVERASAYLAGRTLSAHRIRREIEDLQDEIDTAAAEHQEHAERWRRAAGAEASRLADAIRPRHLKAVRAIGAAVEALSAAVEAERAVRNELADKGVAAFTSLPDASVEFGTLAEAHSPLTRWTQRVTALGLLR